MSAARKLSRRDAAAAAGIAALVVVSRIVARPKTFWEWDDYIFGLALHIFAPQSYVPQPPFFPAFIHAARLANRVLHDDVAALTAVSAIASGAAPVFVWGIARELDLEARVAAAAAVLVAFFPASWFYSGTPISDTAGMAGAAATIWACARSFRRPRAVVVAAVLLGLAFGLRPQAAFVAFPAFVAACTKNGRRAFAAVAAAALSAGLFWLLPVAAAAGGIRPLLAPFAAQSRYVLGVTSPLAGRPPLGFVLRRWLVDPWCSPVYAAAAWAAIGLGVAAISRRNGRRAFVVLGLGAAAYGLCAVLFLDLAATGRYVLPLAPAAAIAAAAGLSAAERRLGAPRGALTAVFVAASIVIVGPALLVMHRRRSPPVEAAARIRAAAGPRFAVLYPPEMYVPAELLFPGVPKLDATKTGAAALAASAVPVWRFGVASFSGEEAAWPPLRPFSTLGMGRYLRVPYGRWRPEPEFGAGWYGEERDADERFRWMGRSGEIRLPACVAPARLSFSLVAPLEALGGAPAVEIAVNGRIVDRRTLTARRTELSYRFDTGIDAASPNRLVLTTDRVFNPKRAGKGSDDRDLGLEIRHLEWGPAGARDQAG